MLSWNYRSTEELIKEIYNGTLQEDIYNYLECKEYDNVFFKKATCYNEEEITENNIFDHFECSVENRMIYSKNLAHPSTFEECLINTIILSVFKRFKMDRSRIINDAKQKKTDERIVDQMLECLVKYVGMNGLSDEDSQIIDNSRNFYNRFTKNYKY